MVMHAIVLGIHFPLVRVWFAAYGFFAALAAPTGQETDTGTRCRFPVDDKIWIVAILTLAGRCDKSRQLQARAEFDQHFLERLAFAGRAGANLRSALVKMP